MYLFYNHERYKEKLNSLSPIEFRTKAALLIFYYFHCLLIRGSSESLFIVGIAFALLHQYGYHFTAHIVLY
ncbi:IS3 family transposase [Pseudogracilibacillus sp. ICA-222130]|uniref:IS3 family transposase n=1 Tax=Pseudogracilibacillus sp. ICA-222130 TaxID=3134655 RepID=UPI0040407156